MIVSVHHSSEAAITAAADRLAGWLVSPGVHNLMVAAGNTPLRLYQRIGLRRLALSHLRVFVLDEYVGVPPDEPRNCANLLQRVVVEPWGIPSEYYFRINSSETEACESIRCHEQLIAERGGLDVIVVGLGRNGHLGFNEPGSAEDSAARVVDLEAISTEANRQWFSGDYAPCRGVTVGMSTILSARRVMLLAFGPHKADAVRGMLEGPRSESCPASLLQGHPETQVFLDEEAASQTDNRL